MWLFLNNCIYSRRVCNSREAVNAEKARSVFAEKAVAKIYSTQLLYMRIDSVLYKPVRNTPSIAMQIVCRGDSVFYGDLCRLLSLYK